MSPLDGSCVLAGRLQAQSLHEQNFAHASSRSWLNMDAGLSIPLGLFTQRSHKDVSEPTKQAGADCPLA